VKTEKEIKPTEKDSNVAAEKKIDKKDKGDDSFGAGSQITLELE